MVDKEITTEQNIQIFLQRRRVLQNIADGIPKRISESVERRNHNFAKLIGEGRTFDKAKWSKQFSQENQLERYLHILNERLKILRVQSIEDEKYRLSLSKAFSELIKNNAPEEIPFRFHGTSFINTIDILINNEISSSVDRIGTETSYDSSDAVSVTTVNTIETTVEDYTDLFAESGSLPCGCIFVLFPKDLEDEKSGQSMLMQNIYFKKNPQQLFRILCSLETLPLIRKQLREIGQNPEIAQEFFYFAETELPQIKADLTSGKKNVGDFIPYRKII